MDQGHAYSRGQVEYGIAAMLVDETRKRLLTLLEESAKAGAAVSDDTRKIGDCYASFIDKAAIESKGIAPLKPSSTRSPPSRIATRCPATSGASSARTSIR